MCVRQSTVLHAQFAHILVASCQLFHHGHVLGVGIEQRLENVDAFPRVIRRFIELPQATIHRANRSIGRTQGALVLAVPRLGLGKFPEPVDHVEVDLFGFLQLFHVHVDAGDGLGAGGYKELGVVIIGVRCQAFPVECQVFFIAVQGLGKSPQTQVDIALSFIGRGHVAQGLDVFWIGVGLRLQDDHCFIVQFEDRQRFAGERAWRRPVASRQRQDRAGPPCRAGPPRSTV